MNERNERRALTFASGMCGTERVFLSSGLKWCYTERVESSTTTWYLRERDPSSLSDIPESLLQVRIPKQKERRHIRVATFASGPVATSPTQIRRANGFQYALPLSPPLLFSTLFDYIRWVIVQNISSERILDVFSRATHLLHDYYATKSLPCCITQKANECRKGPLIC